MTFAFSHKPLKERDLKRKPLSPRAGAFTTFEGVVRNHNDGKKVVAIEYEAFEPLAQKEAIRILKEAKKKFRVIEITCLHRLGRLDVRETAVWVSVSAAHRDHAFKACRYIIDEIKMRLPIWKKEYYAQGDSGWVNCDPTTR